MIQTLSNEMLTPVSSEITNFTFSVTWQVAPQYIDSTLFKGTKMSPEKQIS
jgi:hypothetical protein